MSWYDDVHAEFLRDARDDPDPRPTLPGEPTGEDFHLEAAYEDRFGYPEDEFEEFE